MAWLNQDTTPVAASPLRAANGVAFLLELGGAPQKAAIYSPVWEPISLPGDVAVSSSGADVSATYAGGYWFVGGPRASDFTPQIFRSADTTTWELLDHTTFPSDAAVYVHTFAGGGTLLMLAATDSGNGVAVSSDGGASWVYHSTPDWWRQIHRDPANGNWYALGFESIYVSADNGETWTLMTLPAGSGDVSDLLYAEYADKWFAFRGTQVLALNGLGAWEEVAVVGEAYTSPAAGEDRIFARTSGTGGIRQSVDLGVTWTALADPITGATGTVERLVYGDGSLLVVSGIFQTSSFSFSAPALQDDVTGTLIISGAISETYIVTEEVSGTLTISGGITSYQTFAEAIAGSLTISGDITSTQTFVERADGTLEISGIISALTTFHEVVRGVLEVVGDIKVVERVYAAWAVNLENNGSTRYEAYSYNSFAKIGDRYFGCKPDGVYALDGDDDAGEPIQAMVSFGKQDFGTTALKRVTNIYLGASSTGKLFVKVLVEGEEYLYAARDSSEHLQTQRVDLGRGLRANFLEFELYNADGDDFELASVEFAAVPLTRRI